MTEIMFEVKEADEGGFCARALGADIFTEADDLVQLRETIRDAVHCHFDPEEQPRFIRSYIQCDAL